MVSFAQAAAPPWQEVALDDLPAALAGAPLVLVEFWAPDCLFSRLLAPTRATVSARYGTRLPLMRCRVQGGEQQCAAWGVNALPALVLFRSGQRFRRWIGAMDACLVTRALESALNHQTQLCS